MKKSIATCAVGLLCLALGGCNDYIRTEVVREIYVNKTLINGFVGDEVQLTASPTDGTYQYQWSTEDGGVATVDAAGKVSLVGEGFTNIVVSAGDIRQRVEVYSLVRIPLQDVALSETEAELFLGETRTIFVQRFPEHANDLPEGVWRSERAEVATVSEAGEIAGMGEGTTGISYTVGSIVRKVAVTVSSTKPFNGPHILKNGTTTTVMAADFDLGGLGRAFNDHSPNDGNKNYRRDRGDGNSSEVGVEGNGNNLGWLDAGDWFQYTVDVDDAGKYAFTVSLSAAGDARFRIEVDGVALPDDVDVPNNGSWNDWRAHPATPIELDLPAGKRKIKLTVVQSGFNLRALFFGKD